ncbi:MAG: hypothetical protein FWC20_10595 [Oscillospiraceae bacterium]|nr:hypothetical protein [Oscillospiraceae bacterium]MCL2279837.1 hypothetical protein [Oscillospiraceae bacterium]
MSTINPAQSSYNNYQTPAAQTPAAQTPVAPPADNSHAAPQDTYTPSAAAAASTPAASTPAASTPATSTPAASSSANQNVRGRPADPASIRNLMRETNHQVDAVRRLLSSALGRTDPTGQGWWAQRAENLQLNDAERAEAQALVAEDGFFGVSQTTDRIMDFAMAMVGQNASPDQIEEMRSAVQRGFDDVARMFGGFDNLPQVTRDTHAAIMAQFDDWAASAGGSATTTE